MKTSFARSLIVAVLPFLALAGCDQQPTHYQQLPVYQPAQPVYVEPVAPPIYVSPPPSAIVVRPTPTYYAPPPVTVRTYAPTVVRTQGTRTVITREGAPVRVVTPTPAASAPDTTVYGSKTPATNAPFAGGGNLSDRQGQVTGFRANAVPSTAPASRTSSPTSSGGGLFGSRPSAPSPSAAPSGGSLFGNSRPAASSPPRPSGGSPFGNSRPSPSVNRR